MELAIRKIKENKNGSATYEVDYDKEVSNFIKDHYNRKRISDKLIEKFVIEGLENYLKKEKK